MYEWEVLDAGQAGNIVAAWRPMQQEGRKHKSRANTSIVELSRVGHHSGTERIGMSRTMVAGIYSEKYIPRFFFFIETSAFDASLHESYGGNLGVTGLQVYSPANTQERKICVRIPLSAPEGKDRCESQGKATLTMPRQEKDVKHDIIANQDGVDFRASPCCVRIAQVHALSAGYTRTRNPLARASSCGRRSCR